MELFLVTLFSLCAPGAGQVYNADYGKAAVFGGIFILLQPLAAPLLVRILKIRELRGVLKLAQTVNRIFIAAVILSVVDAVYSAYKGYTALLHISWSGAAYAAVYAAAVSVCYRYLMASPYPDMVAGMEGFILLVRPEKGRKKS